MDTDLESAIAGLFAEYEDPELTQKNLQFDVDGNNYWIEFRVGHSGDAASLAALFSQKEKKHNVDAQDRADSNQLMLKEKPREELDDCSKLELRIASGLGDEQTPPALHAILAEICVGDIKERHSGTLKELGAAAIATIDWNPHQSMRYLRLEEIKVDESKVPIKHLLMRRLLLSLSALALKTACAGVFLGEELARQLKEGSKDEPLKDEPIQKK